jgi:hypothetical protein
VTIILEMMASGTLSSSAVLGHMLWLHAEIEATLVAQGKKSEAKWNDNVGDYLKCGDRVMLLAAAVCAQANHYTHVLSSAAMYSIKAVFD